MVKVKITVIDKNTSADITDSADVVMTNQTTGNTISKRQDGYYHCNYDIQYSVLITTNQTNYVSYGLIYSDLYSVIEERLEV